MTSTKLLQKVIPAVFFQKRLNGATEAKANPERLTLFEDRLAAVTGGINCPNSTVTVQDNVRCLDDCQ